MFTEEDRVDPVCCLRCGAHIPRSVLQQFGGICAGCAGAGGACRFCGHEVVEVTLSRRSHPALAGGMVVLGFGLLLTISIVFAIIGIPMIVAGIVISIVGGGLPGAVFSRFRCLRCNRRW